MALRINFNYEGAVTHTSMLKNEREMNKSLLRLSTGMRILDASDDSAGLFIADQLSLVATGYREGNRNIQMGLSALRIAENAAGQIYDRLKEIYARAVRATSDHNDSIARSALQAEIRNLVDAIQKVGTDTEYNGIKLLNGNFQTQSLKIHYGQRNDQVVEVNIEDLRAQSIGTNLVIGKGAITSATASLTAADFKNFSYTAAQTVNINGRFITTTAPVSSTFHLIDAATLARNINNHPGLQELGFKAYAKNSSTAAKFSQLISGAANVSATITFYVGDKKFTVSGITTQTTLDELIAKINNAASDVGANLQASKTVDNRLVLNTTNGETIAVEVNTSTAANINLDQLIQSASSFTNAQTAAAVKTGSIKITAPEGYTVIFESESNAKGLGFSSSTNPSEFRNLYTMDVMNNENAELAMIIADAALRKVDRVRAHIGAVMNNLQSILEAQRVALDNTLEAENVIRNTDYAEEMTNFTKLQIRMQSGIAMLAQANTLPQLVLQLLR